MAASSTEVVVVVAAVVLVVTDAVVDVAVADDPLEHADALNPRIATRPRTPAVLTTP
jgi:hypothetical protein